MTTVQTSNVTPLRESTSSSAARHQLKQIESRINTLCQRHKDALDEIKTLYDELSIVTSENQALKSRLSTSHETEVMS